MDKSIMQPQRRFNPIIKEVVKKKFVKVLNDIYVLLINIKFKRIWKQHHQYLKFTRFLPNKKKEKRCRVICVIYAILI